MACEEREGRLVVRGEVPIEEVEALVSALDALRARQDESRPIPVDLGECIHMHTAGIQAMLERNVEVMSWPPESDWTHWLRAGFER